MKQLYILLLIVFTLFLNAANPSILFKENKGQWPNKVLFGSDFLNTKFFINRNSFNYCVYNYRDLKKAQEEHFSAENKTIIHGHNYEVNFVDADFSNSMKREPLSEYYNYFLGNNRAKWASNVKAFSDLEFKEIYKGVNLQMYSNGPNLKYDLIIAPKVNPDVIQLNYNYVDGVEIRSNDLVIKTSVGEIIEKAPLSYQVINGKKEQVKCNYILLRNKTVGFEFPNGYDKNLELVIDPVVVVCSYSGAFTQCANSTCTYDALGNIYVVGWGEAGYPISNGAFQTMAKDNNDFVLSAYNTSGSAKYFSTYLGGDSIDFPFDISVIKNEIIILGQSISKNFPTTKTAVDTSYNGSFDFVVSKLNMTGTSLLASTYLGGNGNDGVFTTNFQGELFRNAEMVCDSSGNVHVISSTTSSNFPITLGAISNVLKGTNDACVFKLNSNLSTLIFSTYLGGTATESGKSIRLDGTGGVYCFGNTKSVNFPTTAGSYSPSKIGLSAYYDLYVCHINSSGTSLIASTYLGTAQSDYASLMDVDLNGDVYVCGNYDTPSSLIPTAGVYSDPQGHNAIYKLNPALSSIIFKTKFGYSPPVGSYSNLYFTAFKVDSCKNIYIAGWGDDTYPITPNKFQNYGGGTDMYIAKFNTNCSSLAFGSNFGAAAASSPGGVGEHCDGGLSHFDDKGVLYMAICSVGILPVTSNAYCQTLYTSTTNISLYSDSFLKVDLQSFVNASSSYGANLVGCSPFTANFISATNTGTLSWNFGDGSPISYQNNETHLYNDLGNYNVILVVTDTSTCNKIDSVRTLLSVVAQPNFDLGGDRFICLNNSIQLMSPIHAVNYLWSTGETTSTISIAQPGNYILSVDNGGGCSSYDDVNVIIGEEALNSVFPNIVTPNNDGVNDYIDLSKYNFSQLQFRVFDRWGIQIYQSLSAKDQWDPSGYNDGTYFYIVSYQSDCTGEHKKNKGFVTVIK